ncbi:MAG: 8-amino-7-oxononanoate synthase [Lachnospiraceae bacterium]|nr:8-amino-7-oxononanoate synthase [Lachnospiraceae bacterium]
MKDKDIYSVKMRASRNVDGVDKHISGAEKIVDKDDIAACVGALVSRGLNHEKGNADFLNIKLEHVKEEIMYLDALPVTTIDVETWQDGHKEILKFLNEMNLRNASKILEFIDETYSMRGAMLLDVNILERLEEDQSRGIRATYMDAARDNNEVLSVEKNHYMEAIVLATKVSYCPGMVGEICISDDPGYVTGYVASKECGYRRITKMKESGSENGGRIFLFDSTKASISEAIDYLQNKKVLVRNVKPLNFKEKKDPMQVLKSVTDSMKENNLYRTMKTLETKEGVHIKIDGKEYVLMASNSYLDITAHPKMIQKCKEVLDKYGVGSGGSRLTTGNMDLHEELERKIAKFKNTENAILFNTGYVANLATISAIMKNGGVIYSDELNHASIIDGCRLSKAKIVVYKHNDMEDLKNKIEANPSDFSMAVSDAVFSMDGDILNLPEFVRICKDHGVLSMIDEAHATGVIGKTGHGIVEHFNNTVSPDIIMGTLSKAVGGEGGFVAGNNILIDYLRNTARGFIFSTSLPLVTVASDIAGLEIIESEPVLVERLHENVKYFCDYMSDNGYAINSETAIIPIIIGDEKKAMEASEILMENGFFVSAIRYPTVAKKRARLRIAIMSSHTKEELKRAADILLGILVSA